MDVSIKTTKNKEVIDITDLINSHLPQNTKDGFCVLFFKHTTACLTTADLDPGTDLDLLEALDKLLPPINYRHPHDPSHTPDHILSSIIGASLTVPIQNGQLDLGGWQRVVLIEFAGPRDRKLTLTISS